MNHHMNANSGIRANNKNYIEEDYLRESPMKSLCGSRKATV